MYLFLVGRFTTTSIPDRGRVPDHVGGPNKTYKASAIMAQTPIKSKKVKLNK